jgi:hypothetical protein
VHVLKVMSCDGAAALIQSSVTLVSNSSFENHSREEKEQRGQCILMTKVMVSAHKSSEHSAMKNSYSLKMSEPLAYFVCLFCPV